MQNSAVGERDQPRGTIAVPPPVLRSPFAGSNFSRPLSPDPDRAQRRSSRGGDRIELLLSPAKEGDGSLRRMWTISVRTLRLRIAREALLPAVPRNRQKEGQDQEHRKRKDII